MQSRNPRSQWFSRQFSQPLDRLAITIIVILTILTIVLLWVGDRTAPQVQAFSWQDKQVNAAETTFTMTFNRPMNQESVEANLKFEPPLVGKTSWAGRKMAYTLIVPAIYGKSYTVKLENAFDRFANETGKKTPIQPFSSKFSTPEPQLMYIGAEGEELGRLVLYDLTQKSKRVVTPADLVVTDFRIYPNRDKILFSAIKKKEPSQQSANPSPSFVNPLDQKLYTMEFNPNQANQQGNSAQLLLDSDEYQNFKFDLSADGKSIVVQRLSRVVAGRYGLWVIKAGEQAKPLDNQPGGDFMFAPDSTSVAIAQGEGIAILPLEPQTPPLDFLPRFGTVLSFSRSGIQAAMIQYNKDYTRSLYVVNNQGIQKELAKVNGSILSAQFDPQEQTLYCLMTDVDQTQGKYEETPYLAAIDLKTAKINRLLDLPGQRNLQISISPDGSSLVFDPVDLSENSTVGNEKRNTRKEDLRIDSNSGGQTNSREQRIEERSDRRTDNLGTSTTSATQVPIRQPIPQLKLLKLNNSSVPLQPESLSLSGSRPRWLP
ncbi:Ig-like domain-containing protein [Tumidithrix elongata RA019]|uniref:Ig-like domain-containing protein n=1 Tax=Tumidithrix elongata BACA0141 TaxID=2716417 RepID=A0AAW9Q7J1_9CYAN|nr:Ig-like domain-containing protein [Tumidithrix elongata RA019]